MTSEDNYEELIRELGAIEVYLESLKQRREEIIQELQDDELCSVRVTPVGKKMKDAIEKQGEKHE